MTGLRRLVNPVRLCGFGGGGLGLIEVFLEADEKGTDLCGVAEVVNGVGEGAVFEL